MTILANIAANVAAALATVTTANDAASVVKFNALADFAASVAMRLRVEHINKGSNLETDKKGRIVALVDGSKEQRTALVTALTAAGVGEKDAANIGTMARTVSMHFIPQMVETGSIRVAKSGDEMRAFIAEHLLAATGGVETYNAVEKARGRKWAPPSPEAEEVETTDDGGDATADMSLDATLDTAPEPGEPEADKANPEDVLNAEVNVAVKVLTAALERGDVERLVSYGFRQLLTAGLEAVTAFEKAEAQARAEEEAAALEAQAAKRRKSANG